MKMTENEKNSTLLNQTSTSCSTSSTDSGVIIIDNTTTFNGNNANTKTTTTNTSHTAPPTDKNRRKHQETNNYSNTPDNNKTTNATTKINIENFINISKTSNGNAEQRNGPQKATMPPKTAPSPTSIKQHFCSSKNNSPAVSIRSTTISIVSIDENAIDSSVIDSDSDFEDDTEGVHSNYVVKKLGQQTTYPANSPEIPNINKGLTVISQQISANDAAKPGMVPPLANNLLNGAIANIAGGPPPTPGGLVGPQSTPQIGSIALSNSTDVTFGDKHFYEGPVTIQQFLIDNRDKWKESNGPEGQDNPVFPPGSEGKHASSGDLDPTNKSNENQQSSQHLLLNRKALIITGVITLLTILITALILANVLKSTPTQSKQVGDGDDSRKNIPINSNIGKDNIGGGRVLRIVPRDGWLAQPPSSKPIPLKLPISRVIVISTQTDSCETQAACTFRVRFTQSFNIESTGNDDIIYNFLIGGDGNVYEGRGWDHIGAVLKGHNDDSISFAYIGTFKQKPPNAKQLNVTQLLLAEGVKLGKLSKDYQIIAANLIEPTSIATSADALYASFKGWPHWLEV